MIERVSFTSRDGAPTDGAFAAPAAGRAPAIVVIQEYWGINDQIRHTVQRLADDGFVALAPDLYYGALARDAAEASALMARLDRPRALSEIAGAVELLQRHPRSNGRVAVLGFCLGGALALSAATAVKGLAAVVAFYGVPKDPDQVDWSEVDAPVQAHFSTSDGWAKPEVGQRIQAAVTAAGGAMELYLYDAAHAFMNERRPEVYDAAAAQLAWQRTVDFLRRHAATG